MEQDQNGDTGVKESKDVQKGGQSIALRPNGGQSFGSSGSSSAVKAASKQQASKNQAKKGRLGKNGGLAGREGAVIGINFNQSLPNGTQLPSSAKQRDGRRTQRDEKLAKRNNLSLNIKSRSQNSSRNNSVSPVNQQFQAENEEEKTEAPTPNKDPDVEATTQNLKQLLSLGQPKRIMYTRIQLLNISENPSSKHRPDCLEKDFDANNGRWDPENWHRSLSSPPLSASDKARKFSFSESRDRQDDSSQGGIVLGPQRRSFQDGCHVSGRLSRLHASSPTETPGLNSRPRPRLAIRRSESTSEGYSAPTSARERQIESASALRSEEFDWDRRGDRARDRDFSDLRRGPPQLPSNLQELREFAKEKRGQRDRDSDFKDHSYRDRDMDYRDRKYPSWSRSESRTRRYSNNEPEPEWYTAGPTSQFDTIELGGFEDSPADFSSWGGEIPMDDLETPSGKDKKEQRESKEETKTDLDQPLEEEKEQEELNEESEETEKKKEEDSKVPTETANEAEEASENQLGSLDFNDLLLLPELSSVMEQILRESSSSQDQGKADADPENQTQGGSSAPLSASSRFSQWFQKEQKEGTGSRGSTPHEELENLAELAAERGMSSPVDVEAKQQQTKNDLIRLLTQTKSGSSSPKFHPDLLPLEKQELAKKLFLQQMKSGSVMNVADLEAKVGARQDSQAAGYGDNQSSAFNRLVASIREKDKMRQRSLLQSQQALKFAEANQMQIKGQMMADGKRGTPPLDVKLQRLLSQQTPLDHAGGRIPSPEELAAHTQNIYQQALIKKQLEKQKDAYREKIRQMEQQRREDQLREAIRSADAKLQESKQMNKSLAFMPTSVMRKMQETRDGRDPEMFMAGEGGTHPDALASATASFSAKLANSGKKNQQGRDLLTSQGAGNGNLLARIYQSASIAPQGNSQQQNMARGDSGPGLRRNASYPDVLMDSKLTRGSAFHQPLRQNVTATSLDLSKANDMETAQLRSLLEMQGGNVLNKQLSTASSGMKVSSSGGLDADYYNNNLLKAESQKQDVMSGFGKSPGVLDGQRKISAEPADVSELKNQQEVAMLTQAVLQKLGITEDELSRLTSQEQQTVVSIVREQFCRLQIQRQRSIMEKKAQRDAANVQKMKQGDMVTTSSTPKQEMMPPIPGKSITPTMKPEQSDPRTVQGQAAPLVGKGSAIQAKFSQANMMPSSVPGILPTTNNSQMAFSAPLQIRPLAVPPPIAQLLPPPMARGPAMIPAFLPPQTRLMPPPPPSVSLASPLAPPYQAAALMQMQLYQQQQQRALFAAFQQQQLQQAQQAYAAARHQQNMKSARGSEGGSGNPLERWFSQDILSQSQLPQIQQNKSLTLSDIERMNTTNRKQE